MTRPHDDLKPQSYIRWLDKAKRNYSTAKLNDLHGGYKDTTCYFCHQTVELALKAYLVAKQISFPRVHILPQLWTSCEIGW